MTAGRRVNVVPVHKKGDRSSSDLQKRSLKSLVSMKEKIIWKLIDNFESGTSNLSGRQTQKGKFFATILFDLYEGSSDILEKKNRLVEHDSWTCKMPLKLVPTEDW